MAMDRGVRTVLLLKDYPGEQAWRRPLSYFIAPAQKVVFRGELLLCLSKKQGKYQVASDPTVILRNVCEDHIAPLTGVEYELLIAIESHEARYNVYNEGDSHKHLKWGSQLTVGTCVYATLPAPKMALSTERTESVIRYIGPLFNEKGIHFGVEITVSHDYYNNKVVRLHYYV